MKIYEITSRTQNEQAIHRELIRLHESINEVTMPDAITAPVAATTGLLSKLKSAVLTVLKAASWFFLLEPFAEFFLNMRTASKNLESDKSPDAEKRFQEELVIQVGMLVSAIAAGLLTKGIFRTVTGLLGFVKYIPIVGAPIGGIIEMLSAGAQVYVLKELASDKGRAAIAGLLTGTIFGQHLNGVKEIGTLVTDAVAFFTKTVNDAISNGEKPAADPSKETPADSKTDASKAPETKAAQLDAAPVAKPKNPDELDWTPKPGEEVYTPAGYGRSASGRLTIKPY